jgi:hypothetical protein
VKLRNKIHRIHIAPTQMGQPFWTLASIGSGHNYLVGGGNATSQICDCTGQAKTRAPVVNGKGGKDKALMLSCHPRLPVEGQEMVPQTPERTSAVQGLRVSSLTTMKVVFTNRSRSTRSWLRRCFTPCSKFGEDTGRKMCDLLLVEFVVRAAFGGAIPPVPAFDVPLPMTLASI